MQSDVRSLPSSEDVKFPSPATLYEYEMSRASFVSRHDVTVAKICSNRARCLAFSRGATSCFLGGVLEKNSMGCGLVE